MNATLRILLGVIAGLIAIIGSIVCAVNLYPVPVVVFWVLCFLALLFYIMGRLKRAGRPLIVTPPAETSLEDKAEGRARHSFGLRVLGFVLLLLGLAGLLLLSIASGLRDSGRLDANQGGEKIFALLGMFGPYFFVMGILYSISPVRMLRLAGYPLYPRGWGWAFCLVLIPLGVLLWFRITS